MQRQLLLLLLTPTLTLAQVNIYNASNSLIFTSGDSSYNVQLLSLRTFAPVNLSHVNFIGDLCYANVPPITTPLNDTLVIFTDTDCDKGIAPPKLHAAGVLFTATLYGLENVPPSDPYDAPPRFAYNPGPKSGLIYFRITGTASSRMLAVMQQQQNVTSTFTATLTAQNDPWDAMLKGPLYIFYIVQQVIFFLVYLPQHSTRALILIQRKKNASVMAASSMTLSEIAMIVSFMVGVVKWGEYSCQLTRDYHDGTWVPEVAAQTFWLYGYIIMLTLMLILLLFWRQIMADSGRRGTMAGLDNFHTKIVVVFVLVLLSIGTPLIVVSTLHLPGYASDKEGLLVFLGVIVLFMSFGSMFYGGRIIHALVRNPIQSSSTIDSAEASAAEKERRRTAQKKALPLTRLVIVCAVFLLCITIIDFSASLTGALLSASSYGLIFVLESFCEITVFSIVMHTLSPIWQERRRKDTTKSSQLGGSVAGSPVAAANNMGGVGSATGRQMSNLGMNNSTFVVGYDSTRAVAGTASEIVVSSVAGDAV